MKTTVFLLLLLSVINISAQKRPVEIEDLYRIKQSHSITVSPDNSRLAFVLSGSNLSKSKSSSIIKVYDINTGKIVDVTRQEDYSYMPGWDNEGNLYYVSIKEGQSGFYAADEDYDSEKIEEVNFSFSEYRISDDGSKIAFVTEVFPECGADTDCSKEIRKRMNTGPVQAFMADTLFLRHWDEYEQGDYMHILLLDRESGKLTDETPGHHDSPDFSPGGNAGYDLSGDGRTLIFTSKRVINPQSSTNTDLYIKSIGKEEINITEANKAFDGNPKLSADGRFAAFKTQRIPGYESDRFMLCLYDLKEKTFKLLTGEIDNWVNDFTWSSTGREIIFSVMETGSLALYSVNIETGVYKKMLGGIAAYEFADAGDKIFFVSSSVDKPAEIFQYDKNTLEVKQITGFNDELCEEIDFRPAEQVWIEGAAGKKVHTFIVKPHNFEKGKKYPLILNVHGGPQYQWMNAFRGDWQVYPAKGYVVAFPNPHGSTGYGQDYTAAISGDWGGKVFDDLMKVTDYLASLDYVDSTRMGAMGWSFGGYMMNYFQAKTKRFKCLASMMGIYDLRSFFGITEEQWFPEWDLKGSIWNDSLYKKYSPSEYADNFSTPALIITGEKDYRVPYGESVYYFNVLRSKRIDSRLIVFKNDGHWPSNLKSMPLYYNSHLEWFGRYLNGGAAPYKSEDMIRNIIFD